MKMLRGRILVSVDWYSQVDIRFAGAVVVHSLGPSQHIHAGSEKVSTIQTNHWSPL